MKTSPRFITIVISILAVGLLTTSSRASLIWNAFNDFYVNVPATGGAGNFTQSDWINGAGIYFGDTGLTSPNAWGYAGGNFNGGPFASRVGTFVTGGALYPLTSGGTYAGPGASFLTGGTSFWIGYNDQYGIVGLPNAQTQIGKYTSEWFSLSPNYTANPGGTNNKFLWIQSTGLSTNSDGLGAMLTWTAPASKTYSFAGSYVNGNYGFSTAFAIVDSVGNTNLSRTVLPVASSQSSFSFTRTYSAGDIVQFQVGNPAAGQGSPLGLAVQITEAVPEPSTIFAALFLSGLAFWRTRRSWSRNAEKSVA